jgi:hypothetical protein
VIAISATTEESAANLISLLFFQDNAKNIEGPFLGPFLLIDQRGSEDEEVPSNQKAAHG